MSNQIQDQRGRHEIIIEIRGTAADKFWAHVKQDHLRLLDNALVLHKLPKKNQCEAVLNLITFLADSAFGEDGVLEHRGKTRREYFSELYAINPGIFHLMRAPRDVVLEVERNGATQILKLGRAIGYSAIIPLTTAGYSAYMDNRIAAFEFNSDHILSPHGYDDNCFLYGEGAFHLTALDMVLDAAGVTIPRELRGISKKGPMTEIFQHASRLLPHLELDDDNRLTSHQGGPLPYVLFADNGGIVDILKKRGFTLPSDGFSEAGKAKLNRYVFNTADYNRSDLADSRRNQIHEFVDFYLSITTASSKALAAVTKWLDEELPQTGLPEAARPGSGQTASKPKWYVSYAWGDDTEEGRAREAVVDEICNAADGDIAIIRDKTTLKLGERISAFMRRLGEADRCFIILSDKYLKSSYCMYELCELWRNCREDPDEFLERVRVFALPEVKISQPRDRVGHAMYWKKEYEELVAGFDILGKEDLNQFYLMKKYAHQVSDILATMADILRPRDLEQFKQYGFADAPGERGGKV
jgi:hypothetical protein